MYLRILGYQKHQEMFKIEVIHLKPLLLITKIREIGNIEMIIFRFKYMTIYKQVKEDDPCFPGKKLNLKKLMKKIDKSIFDQK